MHIGELNTIQANGITASLSQFDNDSLPVNILQTNEHKPLAESIPNDLSKDIKEAINSSLVHQLFRALSRSKNSLFKNYNSDIGELQTSASIQEGNVTESVSVSRSEFSAFDLPSSLRSASRSSGIFSLDMSFSQTLTFLQTESVEIRISLNNISVAFSTTQTSVQSSSLEIDINAEQQQADPLILDLDLNGFSFSTKSQNIDFDLNADGQMDSISGLGGEDAFLAIDVNKNGQIDNGLELFGDAGGAKDGFADLRRFDLNGDSIIDAQDRIYDQLLLLSFAENGEQQLSRLSDQNIKSISLDSKQEKIDYENSNQLVSSSTFEKNNGEKGMVGDFLLGIGIS